MFLLINKMLFFNHENVFVFVVIRFIILVKYTIGQIQMANSLLTENAIQSTVRTYNTVNRKVSQIGSDNMFDPMVHVTSRTM